MAGTEHHLDTLWATKTHMLKFTEVNGLKKEKNYNNTYNIAIQTYV